MKDDILAHDVTTGRPNSVSDTSVATTKEVLAFLTEVMRAGDDIAVSSPRIRAAEMLGKHLGAFSEPNQAPPQTPTLIDDIPYSPNSHADTPK